MMRIGSGFDVHRLEKDRPLILGGEKIPFPRGLKGHSDADVVLHAVMDAILGALGEGDIGQHFPPTDESLRGIASTRLLARVFDLMCRKGYTVNNLDITVIAQEPRLAPYISGMVANLSSLLDVSTQQINIKATTTEGLGYTGRKEGIAAQAVVLLTNQE